MRKSEIIETLKTVPPTNHYGHPDDGRMRIGEIYSRCAGLAQRPEWNVELAHWLDVPDENGARVNSPLPIVELSTQLRGEALWVIGGIHGEEPAGPNAIAQNLDTFEDLRKSGIPIVLWPMMNPSGYYRNWRYFNAPNWEQNGTGISVTDSAHVLPDLNYQGRKMKGTPACEAANDIVRHSLIRQIYNPPRLVIDLHEDRTVESDIHILPYIYSQGIRGAQDPVAKRVVQILLESGMKMQMDGKTRFGEDIVDGIVVDRGDESIDDLLSRSVLIIGKSQMKLRKRPARSVVVVETSVRGVELTDRIKAHSAVLSALPELWRLVD